MYVIPCNYGVESIALIEWMRQQKYTNVHCLYVDTGWAASHWPERVKKAEAWVKSIGFVPKTLYPKRNFSELMLEQKKFPTKKFQWCASFLKGLPILEYLDFELDPEMQATIVSPLRRSAARSLVNLPEFVASSEHYNGRKMWYPLYVHSTPEVDRLSAGTAAAALAADELFEGLGGLLGGVVKAVRLPITKAKEGCGGVERRRSLECDPCVNSCGKDVSLALKDPVVAERLSVLEKQLGLKMFVGDAAGESGLGFEGFLRGCGLPFGCAL